MDRKICMNIFGITATNKIFISYLPFVFVVINLRLFILYPSQDIGHIQIYML